MAPAEAAITTMQMAMKTAPRRMIVTSGPKADEAQGGGDSPDSVQCLRGTGPAQAISPAARRLAGQARGRRRHGARRDEGVMDEFAAPWIKRVPRHGQGRLQLGARELRA